VQKDLRMIGSLYGSADTARLIPQLLHWHREGRLPLGTLLGARYRLEEINEAYAWLPAQSVGRSLIMIGES
jgi:Zn-dependent alcohol dehydrogenase